MVVWTKKILDPKIQLIATCVRVPVFVGHSEAVIEIGSRSQTKRADSAVTPRAASSSTSARTAATLTMGCVGEDATYISVSRRCNGNPGCRSGSYRTACARRCVTLSRSSNAWLSQADPGQAPGGVNGPPIGRQKRGRTNIRA
jgi:hypothetical protein